ncbi:MAG: AI-2E family transporter [Synechococcus sp.]
MNAKYLLAILTLVVLTLLIWELRWVLLMLFGAVVQAVALDVPIQKLLRLGLPRPMALAVVLIAIVLGGSLVIQLLVPELIAQVQELGALIPVVLSKLQGMVANEPRLQSLAQALASQFSWERLQPVGNQLIGMAGSAAHSVGWLLMMSLLAVLMALDPPSHQRILIAATPRPARPMMKQVLEQCRTALGGWLTGMTLSATSVFLLTWLGLALLQAPLALLSALICGLLTFVPTIGPTTATLLPLSMAVVVSPALMAQVLVLRLVLQNLEAFLLTPILLRRTVNLLPTVALMAQLSLGVLLGLPGVLLALPFVVVLQVGMELVIVRQVMDRWA